MFAHISPALTREEYVRLSTVLNSRKPHKRNDRADSFNVKWCVRHLGGTPRARQIFDAATYELDPEKKFDCVNPFTTMRAVRKGGLEHVQDAVKDIKLEDMLGTRRRAGGTVLERAVPINLSRIRKALKRARKRSDMHIVTLLLEIARNVKDNIYFERYDTNKDRCRLFAIGPSIQGLSKVYRSIIFGGSRYADVDVVNSVPTDLLAWLRMIGASPEDIALVSEYVNSKDTLLALGMTKTQFLSLIFGAKQTIPELTRVQNVIKKYAKQIDPASLPLPYRQVASWGKKLALVLFAMERKKVDELSRLFVDMGFDTLIFCFDGIILNSAPTSEQLEAVCAEYKRLTGNMIALKIKQVF